MLNNYVNKITCGDCYKLIKEIPDKSVDLIVTDPPYDIEVDHGSGAFGTEKRLHYAQFAPFSHGIKEEILTEFVRVLKKINLYIFCSKKQIPMLIDFFVTKLNCYYDLISWHKTNPVPACGNKYMNDTEYCLFFRQKGVPLYGTSESKKTYYLTPINIKDKRTFNHSTIKPIEIIKNFIINSTEENDIVLDCFAGVATTGVACKELNRRFILFEINPKWAKIGEDRLNNIDSKGQISLFAR